ncbi:IreB family regulatory phosphoprotein [Veillonella montpellierensis]|uniref:IreB family regulatory phosphoprotein n=1 Tax=Veillonella montpellierensis TaxID=187328 RepID=UPI0023F7AD3F|nr:IreB family regulatory phosphoprotein [Veillonella montpellierensis]
MSISDETMMFKKVDDVEITPDQILSDVYRSLKEKGYNPVNQIVGYLISGDPTYITSYNNARSKIRRLERDEIIEELVTGYVKAKGL